jgi:hypothetical protein
MGQEAGKYNYTRWLNQDLKAGDRQEAVVKYNTGI